MESANLQIWKRYVDDTFTKLKQTDVDDFLNHLNNQHPRIKFTTETQEDNKIPFLDVLVHIEPDKSLSFTIYRKKTHTDQYLDFTSNHHIRQKTGIIRTFTDRIDKIVTKEDERKREEEHAKKALARCGYPGWVLNKSKTKRKKQSDQMDKIVGRVAMPYVRHLSEKVSRAFRKYNVGTIHRPTSTLNNMLSTKKDRIHSMDRAGVVYEVICETHNVKYIGETNRALKSRAYDHKVITHAESKECHTLKEQVRGRENGRQEGRMGVSRYGRKRNEKDYKKLNSGEENVMTVGSTVVSEHMARCQNEHNEGDVQIKVVAQESNWWKRGVREANRIRVGRPSMNLDEGRYHISPIWSLIDGHNPSYKRRDIAQLTACQRGSIQLEPVAELQEDWTESEELNC